MHIKTTYVDADAVIRKGRYADNSTALLLFDSQTGEPLSKATVCMVAYDLKPTNERHVFIKNYGENDGMLAALQDAGIVGESLRVLDAGFAVGGVHECLLLADDLMELS